MEFDDFTIRKIAFIVAVFGIVMLLFVSAATEAKFMKIDEISEEHIGNKVVTYGRVIWVSATEKTLLFMIADFGKINCVMFNPTAEQALLVEKGAELFVWGKVATYQGKIEIIVEKVERAV